MSALGAFVFVALAWWPGDRLPEVSARAEPTLLACQRLQSSWVIAMEIANSSQPPALHIRYAVVEPCHAAVPQNDGKTI